MKHSGKQMRPARSIDARAMACSANVTDSAGVAGNRILASAIRNVLIWPLCLATRSVRTAIASFEYVLDPAAAERPTLLCVHERDESVSKRQAHRHRAAAA